MKLRFTYYLRTWWSSFWDAPEMRAQTECILGEDYSIRFVLERKRRYQEGIREYLSVPIEINVSNVQVYRNPSRNQEIDGTLDEGSKQKADLMAAFLADMLQIQAGLGILEGCEATPEYIPESDEDKKRLKGHRTKWQSETLEFPVESRFDLSSETLSRFWNQPELLYLKARAERLNDPISKYRELYRVVEYAYRGLKGHKGSRQSNNSKIKAFDKDIAKYIDLSPEEIRDLRLVRDDCSHPYGKLLTHRNLKGFEGLEAALPKLKRVAEKIENVLLQTQKEHTT